MCSGDQDIGLGLGCLKVRIIQRSKEITFTSSCTSIFPALDLCEDSCRWRERCLFGYKGMGTAKLGN